ncbi:hypothetical protein AYO45_05090 [Gammaproteobacteria bacterium SCGC AG-212-F23]|nr:hypothetical protein AYO45_05090 [Gammaproteobacteria bacterium SCGC AG-212-F23]
MKFHAYEYSLSSDSLNTIRAFSGHTHVSEKHRPAELILDQIEAKSLGQCFDQAINAHKKIKEKFNQFCEKCVREKNQIATAVVQLKQLRHTLDAELKINPSLSRERLDKYRDDTGKLRGQVTSILGDEKEIVDDFAENEKFSKRIQETFPSFKITQMYTAKNITLSQIGNEEIEIYNFFTNPSLAIPPRLSDDLAVYKDFLARYADAKSKYNQLLPQATTKLERLNAVKKAMEFLPLLSRNETILQLVDAVESKPLAETVEWFHKTITHADRLKDQKTLEFRKIDLSSLKQHKDNLMLMSDSDVPPAEKQTYLQNLNTSIAILEDKSELDDLSTESKDNLKNMYDALLPDFKEKIKNIREELKEFEKKEEKLAEEVDALVKEEQSFVLDKHQYPNKHLNLHRKMVALQEEMNRVGFSETALLKKMRIISESQAGKDNPFSVEVKALLTQADNAIRKLNSKKMNTLIPSVNNLRKKAKESLAREAATLQVNMDESIKKAKAFGNSCYLANNDSLKFTSNDWQSIVDFKDEANASVDGLQSIQDEFNLSSSYDDILAVQNNLKIPLAQIEKELPPLSNVFLKQQIEVPHFNGFINEQLIELMIKHNQAVIKGASVNQLEAIDETARLVVSDQELNKRLKAIGLNFSVEECRAINQFNHQIRYRHAIDSAVLARYIVENNITLKSSAFGRNNVPSKIKELNECGYESYDRLRFLLEDIGIRKISNTDLSAIYTDYQDMKREKIQKKDLEVKVAAEKVVAEKMKKVEEKKSQDLQAIRIQASKLQETLRAMDLTPISLHAKKPAELQTMKKNLANDAVSVKALKKNLGVNNTSQEYKVLERLEHGIEVRRKLIEKYENNEQAKLVITTTPLMIGHDVQEYAQQYYLRDRKTGQAAISATKVPLTFSLQNVNTISCDLSKDRSLGSYDHQIQEVIASEMFNSKSLHSETLGRLGQDPQHAYWIYGATAHALEMAKKIYSHAPSAVKSQLKIYVNQDPTAKPIPLELEQLRAHNKIGFFNAKPRPASDYTVEAEERVYQHVVKKQNHGRQ